MSKETLKVLIITNTNRDIFLNKVLHGIKGYFNLEVEFVSPLAISLQRLSDDKELIIFDEVEHLIIKKLNLFYVRSISNYCKFVYLSQVVTEEIEDSLFDSSIDFVIRKSFIFSKVSPKLIHCMNLILNEKKHFNSIKIKGRRLDIINKTLSVGDKTIELTQKEFLIIFFLQTRKGEYVERSEIFYNVWGYKDEDSSRLVDQKISKIRKMVGLNFITNKYGGGYMIK